MQINFKKFMILLVAFSCSILAVLWSQWRNELWAEYYCYTPYDYDLSKYGISGMATLRPKAKLNIKGKIKLLERADGFLSVEGEASGFNPNVIYFSFLHDLDSRPNGREACESSSAYPYFIGIWQVDSDGNGILSRDIPNTKLRFWRTISIYDYDFANLEACGLIKVKQ